MSVTAENAAWFAQQFQRLTDNIGQALLGKAPVIRLALTCLLAEGHLLLEDAPGTGKTALARAIAATVQGEHSRIQFTPDLLPLDITGVSLLDHETGKWEFQPGPVFTSILLADEINRASPKTQSALLEVMEESQVTVDGITHRVDRPFMVIATQNPIEQAGTYRLPEAQLDRFLMRTSVGYPDRDAARQVLVGSATPDRSRQLSPVISTQAVAEMADGVKENHVANSVLDYVLALAEHTRDNGSTTLGVSTRGTIALVRAARVWAAAHGRNFVLPDDVKELAAPVWTHRLVLSPEAEFSGVRADDVIAQAIAAVEAPSRSGPPEGQSGQPMQQPNQPQPNQPGRPGPQQPGKAPRR